MQPTDETKSDPLSIDNTETSEKLLNHIHCETTDDESDTENTLLLTSLQLNMNMEHQLNQIITKRKLLVPIVKNQIVIKNKKLHSTFN